MKDREIAVEQAAVALLSEIAATGFDVQSLADKAKAGIRGNEIYTWVGPDNKDGAVDAVDYLIGAIR